MRCKLTIIGSDNGLSPGWRQALIWTIAGILLIALLGRNLSEILNRILTADVLAPNGARPFTAKESVDQKVRDDVFELIST